MSTCGAAHPEAPSRTCIYPAGHKMADHVDAKGAWPNTDPEVVEALHRAKNPPKRKSKKSEMVHVHGEAQKALDEARAEEQRQQVLARYPMYSKESGMATSATSEVSRDFREVFWFHMKEVAKAMEEFSTNDVWELIEARGIRKDQFETRQATGTLGPRGVREGHWVDTGRDIKNTSGNGHSKEQVSVYRSLIVGRTDA